MYVELALEYVYIFNEEVLSYCKDTITVSN